MAANGVTQARRLKVAIIGGGPGGLATAIALDKVPNVEVALYEKAKLLREVGAGINVGQNTWNVLGLLGAADSLTSGHPSHVVISMNGRTGQEVHRSQKPGNRARPTIRTERTKLQSALLAHVKPGVIRLSKQLVKIIDLGGNGVELYFADGTQDRADLVVGADGIRSVVRDSAWPEYEIKFTGTTIWRALLPRNALKELDARFDITGWWHLPASHVYFSPVSDTLSEIASREYQDPAIHSVDKVVWGVPVANAYVESHFNEYLPQIQEALKRIPTGEWREFAAFTGPELSQLTAWDNKVVLVGDSSHALSGAFGSGAGFAMEDGWILAQALLHFKNDLSKALPLFDTIRLPYYHRMYEHLASGAQKRQTQLKQLENATEEDKVNIKVQAFSLGSKMDWIYENNIALVWEQAILDYKQTEINKEDERV